MHGVWLRRVGELRGLADASHCRVIAKNGPGVTSICQHHFYTGCTSLAIVNAVITRMFNRKFRLMRVPAVPAHRSYFVSSRSPSPFVFHRSHLFAVRSVSPLAICTTKNGDSSRTVDRRANRVEACQHHRLQQPIANAVPGLGHTQRESVEAARRRNQWAPGTGTRGLKINPSM